MGIQSRGKINYSSKVLTFDQIIYLLERIHACRKTANYTARERPKVSIDASLIAFKYTGASVSPIASIQILSECFCDRGIDVAGDLVGMQSQMASLCHHKEDLELRDTEWDKIFDLEIDRVFMHDGTNNSFNNPTNATQQR